MTPRLRPFLIYAVSLALVGALFFWIRSAGPIQVLNTN